MDVIVLKYVQLVCFSIFMSNSANCAQLMSTSEEMNNLKVSACAANCLKTEINYNLTSCYQSCVNQTEFLDDVHTVEAKNETGFHLYCRDSNRLVIQFFENLSAPEENERLIYLLVIQESTMKFVDRFIYISDEPMIELRDLKPSESYNVSATIVSSNNDVRILGMQKFTTLKQDYVPENVTDIWVEEQELSDDGEHVNVVVGWKNARDRTCLYDVIFHDSSMDIKIYEKASPNLYYHELKNLEFNSNYAFAVRGINVNNTKLESVEVWKEFSTKSCDEFKKNFCTIKPKIWFMASFINIHTNVFRINITVNSTESNPDYYRAEIRDINKKKEEAFIFTFNGNLTSYLTDKITIEGSECWINMSAFYDNGTYYDDDYQLQKIDHLKKPRSMFMSFFIYTLFIVASMVLVISFLVWQGRINFFIKKYTQKQLDNIEVLDLIKSISNRTILEAIADLTRDQMMEVERENITLLEALGEGAFGLVKRATVVRGGENHQVAVKMLKNTANIEDIKQFHQEISVMKSVGKHPNIVGIIGHCTSNIEELMLLTEFCDAGSLLDLLRSEFARQLSFYDKKKSESPQKYPDSMHNFDSDEKNISYKNFGCSSRLFVVNQMYDDLNEASSHEILEIHQRQAPLKAIEMTATNALYLQLSDNDPQPVIIEIPETKQPENFLTSSDLVSFAKQVADGMDFLARKKVVHRDLAARNVLVCSDKSVKIADFGLSRDIYQDNIYRKVGNGKLPIKWLAVESMTHQVYTSQSDVWSFGILLYEIVTLGATPYPSIGAEQLLKILHSGYRMEKPRHCHPSLYDVMLSCWAATPTERPAFEELSCKLNHFLRLENSWDDRFIDLPKLFDKCTSEMNYMKPIA